MQDGANVTLQFTFDGGDGELFQVRPPPPRPLPRAVADAWRSARTSRCAVVRASPAASHARTRRAPACRPSRSRPRRPPRPAPSPSPRAPRHPRARARRRPARPAPRRLRASLGLRGSWASRGPCWPCSRRLSSMERTDAGCMHDNTNKNASLLACGALLAAWCSRKLLEGCLQARHAGPPTPFNSPARARRATAGARPQPAGSTAFRLACEPDATLALCPSAIRIVRRKQGPVARVGKSIFSPLFVEAK